MNEEKNIDGLRIIKTGRNQFDINSSITHNFRPLVKKVVPDIEKIKSKYAVLQNKITGEVREIGDYRSGLLFDDKYEILIDWVFYYPYQFESPYAAYLIPNDIKVGEKVFLEDVIEDIIAGCWNQGNAWRVESAEAIWNGEDFDIIQAKEQVACVKG